MERKPENRPQTVQEWLDLLPKSLKLLPNPDSTTVPPVEDIAGNTIPEIPSDRSGKEIKIPNRVTKTPNSQTKTDNLLELLARATLMGVAFWLLVLCLFKLSVSLNTRYVFSLIICIGFLFIGQYHVPPNEPKINLFISAIVPTLLILLIIFLKIVHTLELSSLSLSISTLLTIGAGVFAFTLMAILKFFRESDYET